MSPLKAIKAFCLQCSGDNAAEVKRCTAPTCPLFPYKTGHDTTRTSSMTEEQKEAARERLRKLRESL